ncbi:hypothetical protein [Pantoea ananatis]|uniref:hypothetical protein n=1 Tax=Pantoea ananas TaxID=553 RepID=UPI003F967ED6
MKSHESPAPENGSKGQQRCAPEPLMQVHENHYIKCAGVAGLRVRAKGVLIPVYIFYPENYEFEKKIAVTIRNNLD